LFFFCSLSPHFNFSVVSKGGRLALFFTMYHIQLSVGFADIKV